jgi:acylphosphatase
MEVSYFREIIIAMATIRILIKGKVQGVFYRASAQREARSHGLKGWVKNTKDGDVEIVATGEEHDLEPFIKWCHEGPAGAHVTEVLITQVNPESFEGFSIV